eukprot:CAMPEP_0203763006 /NCGR_PEP_ID=MMETSP0098-20131031/15739_1 /ASSEMBLY_ACC=CAM_ASM_000208 /TAXON_ID=96639 /ORGANISM=" , Strain NY0313808BC1" /LENGTH=418 /DNA_ID=CAMNT_0050657609 /DNA_START=307 /DNA_END=1563 /DNA_ORIENTATION=-
MLRGGISKVLGGSSVAEGLRGVSQRGARSFSSSVFSWGNGDDGQLGQNSIDKSGLRNHYIETTPIVVPGLEGQDVVDVACGFKHSAAVTADGRVLTWGKVESNLLGHDAGGMTDHCLHPRIVSEGLENVKAKQVVAGENHTAILSDSGDLFTWGWGGSFFSGAGALGVGDTDGRPHPTRVLIGGDEEIKLKKISAGKNHMIALGMENEVWSWGRGENGRLGHGGNSDCLEPYPVELFWDLDVKIVDIACGHSFNLALDSDGKVWGWGKNDQSQLGLGGGISMDVYAMEDMPRQLESLDEKKIVKVGAGAAHAVAVTDKGEVYSWGMRLWMEPHLMSALSGERIVSVDCGNGVSACLNDAGQVFTWGKGYNARQSGVLGHGDTSRHAQPELVQALASTPIKKVTCGNRHILALSGMPQK